jgi:DNA-binding LacI/PurR family transcriptional regulator/DNA-binding transcriptional regulator YhcF (GntR family)
MSVLPSETLASPRGLGGRSVEVFLALREDLDRNVFAEGSKLPTEEALCQRFHVSRSTVRRAVAQLVGEGRVTVRKGAGMFARRAGQAKEGSRTISIMYMFDDHSLAEWQDYVMATGHLQCAFSQLKTYWDPAQERAFLEGVKAERHKALLAFCSPREPLNEDLLAELVARGVRVLHIEYYRPVLPRESYLLPDYRRAGHMGAMRLILANCHDLRYTGMGEAPYEVLLEKGFEEALAEHRDGYDRQKQFFAFPTQVESSHEAAARVRAFVESLPPGTGVFCRSRELAAGLVACAKACGRRVPQDLRVVGFGWQAPQQPPGYELICCDRAAAIRRAVDLVTAPVWTGVRELVAPKLHFGEGGKNGG